MKNIAQNFNKHNSEHAELELLRKEVKILNDRLKKSENFKSSFLSNLRNEIINPISGILGLSGSIAGPQAHDGEQLKKLVRLIHEEVFDLHYHLASLFQAAAIESGEVYINTSITSAEYFLSSFFIELQPLLDKKQVTISSSNSPELSLTGDLEKLKLISIVFLRYILQLDEKFKNIKFEIGKEGSHLVFKIHPEIDSGIQESSTYIKDEDILNSMLDIKISMAKNLIEMMGGKLQLMISDSNVKGFLFTVESIEMAQDEAPSDLGDIIF